MIFFRVLSNFRLCSIIIPSIFIATGISAPEWKVTGNRAFATELLFTSSVGYNSNPALESRPSVSQPDQDIKGSPFSIHTLSLEQGFTIADKCTIDVSPSVTYLNLWEMPDNHQFNLGISLSPAVSGKRFTSYLFTNALLYRDSMIEPDERDEFTLGAVGEIVLSGRYTLAFEHSWQRISYLKDAPLFFHEARNIQVNIGRNGNMNNGGNSDMNNISLSDMDISNQPLQEIYSARDDLNMLLKTRLDIFLLPSLTASAGLKYEYLVSSLDAESFWQLTPNIKIVWDFASQWQFLMDTQVERRKYFNVNEQLWNDSAISMLSAAYINNNLLNIRDINCTTSLDMRLVYFWNNIEIFTDFLIEHGEYPLNNESYNQRVLQCGFSWAL